MTNAACELCSQPGGEVLYSHDKLRIVLVDEPNYPGFCRVIWNAHVREMSDLEPAQRILLMEAVWHVEQAVRESMQPDKINLASLGNMTPHLHWHVIPRYRDDVHFPGPVWAQAQREPVVAQLEWRRQQLPALRAAVARRFGGV